MSFGRICGSNSRMVASRCVRLARCCASCCSSRRSIPASSARLSRSAPMTCCSAIAAFSCDTQDQEHSEQASGHEQLGGGLCYMISSLSAPIQAQTKSQNHCDEVLAARGKTSMGWFYGLKLHFVINHK